MNKFIGFISVLLISIGSQTSYAQEHYPWKSIAAGEDYTIAVRFDGTLWSWGRNNYGQLGDGTLTDRDTPQQIGTANNWIYVSTRGGHVVALINEGIIYSWGRNNYGQVGNNDSSGENVLVPQQIGTAKWRAVYAGDQFTIAIGLSTPTVWAWGLNNRGQFGVSPETVAYSLTPYEVPVPKTHIVSTIYSYPTWSSFSVGKDYIIAVRETYVSADDSYTYTLWGWGDNTYGQLGTGTASTTPTEIQQLHADTDWKRVIAGEKHVLALKDNGTLWLFGNNTSGELGINTTTIQQASPQQLGTDTWKHIAAGGNFSAGIKTDGTLWSWGANDYGQLGNSTTTGNFNPVQESSASNNWRSIFTGSDFVLAIKTDATLWAWGNNTYGQLGLGHQNQVSQPQQSTLMEVTFQPSFEELTGIDFTGVSRGSVAWADNNNDGLPDVLITGAKSGGYAAELWKNKGNNQFEKVETATFAGVSHSSIAWGDYNNDGLPDIMIVGTTTGRNAGASSKLYKNNGDDTFTEIINPVVNSSLTIFKGVWNMPSVAWADYNNDGHLDVVISGNYYTGAGGTYITSLYKNNGNGTFTEQTPLKDGATTKIFPGLYFCSVAWADYNNDGFKDLLITGNYNNGGAYTRLYKNNSDETFSEVSQTDAPFTGVQRSAIAWADYNNDGFKDVMITGQYVSKLYKNRGNGSFEEVTTAVFPQVSNSTIAWADINADGLPDLVLGGFIVNRTDQYVTKIFKNNGDDTFTEIMAPLPQVQYGAYTLQDADMDGKPELLITGYNFPYDNTTQSKQYASLYKNVFSGSVILPSAPQNLASVLHNGKAKLTWEAPTTAQAQANGLRYNLRIGTSSGSNDILSGANQYDIVVANSELSFILQKTLDPTKTYYYSIQAVDQAGNKSPWSAEQIFTQQTLPVELVSFTVVKNTNHVKISWQTSQEKNSDYFVVQRITVPETAPVQIAKINSNENGGTYNAIDYAPLTGINYYKLIQVDKDGTAKDHGLRQIYFGLSATADITVYPNPTTGGIINIDVKNNTITPPLNISITSINGNTVFNSTVNEIFNSTIKINPNKHLNPGLYIIKASNKHTTLSTKLIVK